MSSLAAPPRRAQAIGAAALPQLARVALERLAAQQPCADRWRGRDPDLDAAAVRAGRARSALRREVRRPGLDARLNTDLSALEPDRLITPNDPRVRPHGVSARAARRDAAVDDQDHWIARARGGLHGRRPRRDARPHGRAPLGVFRQQQPRELRVDERRGVGRCAARRYPLPAAAGVAGDRGARSPASTTTRSARRAHVRRELGVAAAALDRLGAFLARRG